MRVIVIPVFTIAMCDVRCAISSLNLHREQEDWRGERESAEIEISVA